MDKKIKLLILEDRDKEPYFDINRLDNLGITVLISSSFAETVDICKQQQIDIIFVNLLDNNSQNFTSIASIKENHRTEKIPVVAASFESSENLYKKALSTGANLFVELPVPLEILLEKLKDLLFIPRRRHERIDLSDNPGKIEITSNTKISGDVVNISLTGMLINLKDKLQISETFSGKIFLPGDSQAIAIEIRIIRQEHHKKDFGYSYGVEIDSASPLNKLEEFLKQNSQRRELLKYYS
jgi:response regulator RpfG family c-di-GMP phosphodiesterase